MASARVARPRLVELHAGYRWLCGGVAVAYHRLHDFRSDHGDVFRELVTQLLARLMLEQIEARTGVRPTELLVDGGYPVTTPSFRPPPRA